MSSTIEERQETWNTFLQRWPLETLGQMTLEQYAQAGNKDSFVNWLETGTDLLGSMWGGSSFKFGVYSRKDQTIKPNGGGLCYTQDYAWLGKYGDSPETAFQKVLAIIVQIAEAARAGDLATIEAADLGTVTKWKIAFLYQDRNKPCVLPIYKKESLQAIASSDTQKSCSAMHSRLMAKRGELDVLAYGDELWSQIQVIDDAKLDTGEAYAFFDNSDQFEPVKPATKNMSGFRTPDGLEIALALDNKTPTLYLSQGAWLDGVRSEMASVDTYAAARSRTGSIGDHAPALGVGNAIVKVTVPTRAALVKLCEAYLGTDVKGDIVSATVQASTEPGPKVPLNQILFGPPGTGKTYATIDAALEILDPNVLKSFGKDRPALKARFDELRNDKRIQFVTFHQSFSYEDFIEGLRANTDDATGQLKYFIADGVFKTLCEAAAAKVTRRAEGSIDIKGRRIWKMSLGNTQGADATIFDECMAEGIALLGYGNSIDFKGCQSRVDVLTRFNASGTESQVPSNDYAVTSVTTFVTRMKKGDLLVISDGNFKFRAIGEITGDYQFRQHPSLEEGYAQSRSVRWLRQYQPSLPHGELMNNQFSQMTLYELRPGSINVEKLQTLLGATDAPADGKEPNQPRVLIIDEINRGNVSRIFGELITLIEPSKRAGAEESLEVVLPYSKTNFSVPDNVYLIGTMNTADRSLAGLDVALRRRFVFKEMLPKPDLLRATVVGSVNIGALLAVMNQRIEALLDREHCIGHAYFMPLLDDGSIGKLAEIFKNQVLPLLQEYFFEDWQRIQWVLNDHRKADDAHRFILADQLNTTGLFGNNVNVSHRSQTWRVNGDAFLLEQSYLGVLNTTDAT